MVRKKAKHNPFCPFLVSVGVDITGSVSGTLLREQGVPPMQMLDAVM